MYFLYREQQLSAMEQSEIVSVVSWVFQLFPVDYGFSWMRTHVQMLLYMHFPGLKRSFQVCSSSTCLWGGTESNIFSSSPQYHPLPPLVDDLWSLSQATLDFSALRNNCRTLARLSPCGNGALREKCSSHVMGNHAVCPRCQPNTRHKFPLILHLQKTLE